MRIGGDGERTRVDEEKNQSVSRYQFYVAIISSDSVETDFIRKSNKVNGEKVLLKYLTISCNNFRKRKTVSN